MYTRDLDLLPRIWTESQAYCCHRGSEWEVLDFIDVVVHIFTEKQRAFYDLDGYYGMAEVLLSFLDGHIQ